MIDTTYVLGATAVCLFATWYYNRYPRCKNLPPGPRGLPILGSVLDSHNNPQYHEDLLKLHHKYGPVFTLWFGKHPVIVINGTDAIQKALVETSSVFNDRPYWFRIFARSSNLKGIVFSKDHWRESRKLVLATLKDFGLGKSLVEERIQTEASILSDVFKEHDGKPFNSEDVIYKAVANIIFGIAIGTRFEYDNEQFIEVLKALQEVTYLNPFYNPGNFSRLMLAVLFLTPKVYGLQKRFEKVRSYVYHHISDHRETVTPGVVRDFVDMYLQTEKTAAAAGTDEEDAYQIIRTLLFAGSDTAATTLQWFFLYMIHYPEVQEKCYQEIKQAIGDNEPNYTDRSKMTYFEAVLLEVQRHASVVPLSLPHMTNRDVELNGYTIPKGACIIPSLFSSHMDPTKWDEPRTFNPDRWIDEKGHLIVNKAFMPFGTGPRTCLGEKLAKTELFMFSCILVQRFKFQAATDGELPSMEGDLGVTLRTLPFELRAIPR